jgi:hypothetical protein
VSIRSRRLTDEAEINFVPLLDMVSVLIQVLLLNAQFGVFAQMASQLGTPVQDGPTGLQLSVHIEPAGYTVGWSEGEERKSQSLPCIDGSCLTPEAYDRAGLRSLAMQLKGQVPAETQGLLVPAPGVPFEAVIGAMDALRAGPPPEDVPLFPDLVLGDQ